MILNKDDKGTSELRALTGNYAANNKFSKIEGDVTIASSEVANIIGQTLFDKVEADYIKGTANELIEMIQRPIAYMACLRFFKKNDLSHEDDGRKFKLASDTTEKLPWEWQLDRDDSIMLDNYYEAIELLLRHLITTGNEDYKLSNSYKLSSGLLIKSGQQFNDYFSIQRSERMYIVLLPTIREAQMRFIAPAYGIGFNTLIEENQVPESDAHFAACKATALLAMSIALNRGPIQLIPAAVIRGYMAENGAANSSPASIEDIRLVAKSLELDAKDWLERMKEARDGSRAESSMLHRNDSTNKYFVI